MTLYKLVIEGGVHPVAFGVSPQPRARPPLRPKPGSPRSGPSSEGSADQLISPDNIAWCLCEQDSAI